jgi:hypothetical protein
MGAVIRVERETKGKNGKFRYRVVDRVIRGVEGFSRQPLLDACRALKRIGVATDLDVGLFREGSTVWGLKTTAGYGAGKTSSSRHTGSKLPSE